MERDIEDILKDPELNSRIFYPRYASAPEEIKEEFRILNFEVEEGVSIGGILFLNEDYINCPTLIFFHGNGEISLDYDMNVDLYLNCGVNFAIFDYRNYGFSTGVPTYIDLIRDPIIIYNKFKNWLESEYSGIISEVLFVMGRSLGSVCASVIGANNPSKLHGLIFESGYADTYRILKELFCINNPNLNRDTILEYSNHIFIHKIQKPCLVIHGMRDNIIPFGESQYIFRCIPEVNEKKLIAIKSADHNNIMSFSEEYFPPLYEFIQKYKY